MELTQTGTLLNHEIWTASSGNWEFDFVPEVGASTLGLRTQVRGRKIDVFAPRSLSELGQGLASDPNFAFKRLNTPLFPLANRLLPDERLQPWRLNEAFTATVKGIQVRMPLNNQAPVPGSTPHQLHGLLFKKAPRKVQGTVATFESFFENYWTGEVRVEVAQAIENNAFVYRIKAQNIGKKPVPVGFGSHPYFKVPGGDASQVRIVIPSNQMAEIDNLQNVLPTGRWLPTRGTALDFNSTAQGSIAGHLIDNYFVLDRTVDGLAKAIELHDRKAGISYRMQPLTENIVGAQMFYPGTGDVVALELVTHHPDPREALWGAEATGMRVLKPDEAVTYAYKIEVRELE